LIQPYLWIANNEESHRNFRPHDNDRNLHLKRVEREKGEFDNSVRKSQHQRNKTCYEIT